MPYSGPFLGDEDDDREYEDETEYEDDEAADESDLGDDLPEWWSDDMPDDWLDLLEGAEYEYEEFEIGIDYGEAT